MGVEERRWRHQQPVLTQHKKNMKCYMHLSSYIQTQTVQTKTPVLFLHSKQIHSTSYLSALSRVFPKFILARPMYVKYSLPYSQLDLIDPHMHYCCVLSNGITEAITNTVQYIAELTHTILLTQFNTTSKMSIFSISEGTFLYLPNLLTSSRDPFFLHKAVMRADLISSPAIKTGKHRWICCSRFSGLHHLPMVGSSPSTLS